MNNELGYTTSLQIVDLEQLTSAYNKECIKSIQGGKIFSSNRMKGLNLTVQATYLSPLAQDGKQLYYPTFSFRDFTGSNVTNFGCIFVSNTWKTMKKARKNLSKAEAGWKWYQTLSNVLMPGFCGAMTVKKAFPHTTASSKAWPSSTVDLTTYDVNTGTAVIKAPDTRIGQIYRNPVKSASDQEKATYKKKWGDYLELNLFQVYYSAKKFENITVDMALRYTYWLVYVNPSFAEISSYDYRSRFYYVKYATKVTYQKVPYPGNSKKYTYLPENVQHRLASDYAISTGRWTYSPNGNMYLEFLPVTNATNVLAVSGQNSTKLLNAEDVPDTLWFRASTCMGLDNNAVTQTPRLQPDVHLGRYGYDYTNVKTDSGTKYVGVTTNWDLTQFGIQMQYDDIDGFSVVPDDTQTDVAETAASEASEKKKNILPFLGLLTLFSKGLTK